MNPKSKILSNPIYIETNFNTLQKAKVLRNTMTEAEKILWDKLSERKINELKFRRQHAIGQFIVDFYCHEKKLVIEVDGSYHLNSEQKEHDGDRTYELEKMGLHVLRFSNEEAFSNVWLVVKKIKEYIEDANLLKSPPVSSPNRED